MQLKKQGGKIIVKPIPNDIHGGECFKEACKYLKAWLEVESLSVTVENDKITLPEGNEGLAELIIRAFHYESFKKTPRGTQHPEPIENGEGIELLLENLTNGEFKRATKGKNKAEAVEYSWTLIQTLKDELKKHNPKKGKPKKN